jgi:hypothetical protein
MWSIDSLQSAIEKRNEHLKFGPEAEAVILAAERANGRTEERVNSNDAKNKLKELMATLKPETLSEPLRASFPKLFGINSPKTSPAPETAPTQEKAKSPAPLQKPAPAFDKQALVNLITATEAAAKQQPTTFTPTQQAVSLDASPVKDKDRSRGGPSR